LAASFTALVEQQGQRADVSDRRRVHQWRRASAAILLVDVGSVLQQFGHRTLIAATDGHIERVGSGWLRRLRDERRRGK